MVPSGGGCLPDRAVGIEKHLSRPVHPKPGEVFDGRLSHETIELLRKRRSGQEGLSGKRVDRPRTGRVVVHGGKGPSNVRIGKGA